jgi:hypothetical protein
MPAAPRKQFKGYNFTPLNAPINEILMGVKKDPDYEIPRKILWELLEQNKDKYCAYHDAVGHLTKGCIALRLLIEKFIDHGKLVHFLRENRA